jgi:hypothetical protein
VAIVRPTLPDAILVEAVHRIGGELRAEGFDVLELDAPPEPASPTSGGRNEPEAIAVLALTVDEGTRIAELRVVDRLTNKVVIRRSPVDVGDGSRRGPSAAEVLAVRAVELLRASLLELLVESRRPTSTSAPPAIEEQAASRWAARALPAERPPAWGVEAGAEVVGDFTGVPPALLALLRVRRLLAGPFAVRLSVGGLGTLPRVEAAAGSATVAQAFGLSEILVTFGAAWPVRPLVSIGGGASYVAVEGRAEPPFQPRRDSRWGFAGECALGADLPLGRHVGLSMEGHVRAILPYPVVQIAGSDAAKTGVPALAGSLTLVGWL